MGSLRTRNFERRSFMNKLNLDVDDSEPRALDFVPSSSSSSGERKLSVSNDEQSDNTVPCEDAFLNNDAFDTQVMDVEFETQPIDLDDETQIMELAGKTQVMDDYDFVEHMDTQLLDLSDDEDSECKGDTEGAEGTQPLDDTEGLHDVQLQDGSGNQIIALGKDGTSNFRQDNGGATAQSLPSDNVAQSSGSSRRGFPSVRTASLRAAGLAARQSASKKVANESNSTKFSSVFSDLHPSDDFGGNVEKVSLESDVPKCNEEKLGDGNKSNIARSLARNLFLEEVVTEIGSDVNVSDRKEDLCQLPSCDNYDNDVAGLSYVDSQEPGELSQVNALEFVDRFLKVNVFESDRVVMHENDAGEIGNPGAIAKGVQTTAKKASRRSLLAEATIFEWDDNLEDEGGGDFFTKKKDILLGHKSCPKPHSSHHRELRGRQSLGKKEQQNLHGTMTCFLDSDLKLVDSGKKGKVKKMDKEKKICSGQQLAALPSAQEVDMQNVGIDTQMAAEAMEELSAGIALLNNNNNSSVADQGGRSETDRSQNKATKIGPSKQGSREKRACLFTSGVVTRSRIKEMILNSGKQSKCYFTPKTRGQSVVEKLNVGRVKPNEKQNRLSIKETLVASRREQVDTRPACVGRKRSQSILEGQLNNNQSRPSKRRSSLGKDSIFTPVVQEAAQCTENADDASGDSRGRHLHGGPVVTVDFVSRRTRSRRSNDQHAECPRDGKGLLSRGTLSLEDARQLSSKKQDACSPPVKGTSGSDTIDGSPENMQKSSNPKDITPVNLKTPRSAVSPICKGDGYQTPSCKKRISLRKEVTGLIASEDRCSSPFKGLRQRRDMNNVRVLFSQHLDDDTVRHQKKILSRLGVSMASTILEATHFVADSFVRTRNMLEAIANAKPVVTHLWLESCGQANCFIDEKNYILRDAKKEKELGFSMPKSLAQASRYPLLEGKKVLITPNVKPGKEVILSLVKAVHGQAIERLGRSISSNEKLLDDLLVLSCEEDFRVSVPLLEKGIAIYSSELLLNGIITQRLEYERYHLFVAHVKKTRSTLWLKKGGERFFPVTKTK